MKTAAQYLAAAGITGDAAASATAALSAALQDAQAEISAATEGTQREIRENQQARALAAAFRKVADAAGVDVSGLNDSGMSAERRRELSDAAARQVQEYVAGAGGEASAATAVLSAAGFDLDAWRKAGKDRRAELGREFADAVTGNRARLRAVERDAALTELNLDARKAGRILGDVTLEKGKVTVKDRDGNPAEVETWGVRGADGAFTPAERLITDAGWTMAELAPRAADAGAGATKDATADAGWFVATGQEQAAAETGGALDFLNPSKKE